MYNIKFMNTYNSVIYLRTIIKPDKTEDYYLEKTSCNTYLENNKVLINNYDNLKTEFVFNNNLLFCYASINKYKILFNVLKVDDKSVVRNTLVFNKIQLSELQKIDQAGILGMYIYYTNSASAIEFKVINTCDCFNSYCTNNGIWPNKDSRVNLLTTFKQSLTTTVIDKTPSEKTSKINGHEFTFVCFYNLMIIIDYNKVTVEPPLT